MGLGYEELNDTFMKSGWRATSDHRLIEGHT